MYSIFIIPTIVLLRHRANMVTDNTKFIKLQIIYNFIACISAQLSFTYLLYKFHGGYNAIIGIAYQILILSLTYYKSLKNMRNGLEQGLTKTILKKLQNGIGGIHIYGIKIVILVYLYSE